MNDLPQDSNQTAPEDLPSLSRSLVQLVGLISLPAAALGVVAAFLGWRASAAYNVGFGLGPGWGSFDVIGMIMLGWVEALLLVLLVAALVISQSIVEKTYETVGQDRAWKLFLIFLFATILCVLWLRLRAWAGTRGFLEFAVVGGLTVLAWWLCALFGMKVFSPEHEGVGHIPHNLQVLLSALFSSRITIWILTTGLMMYYLLTFAGGRGWYLAQRDQSPDSHLSYVNVISSIPLNTPSKIVSGPSSIPIYEYENLRLVFETDRFIVVFSPGDADPVTGIPRTYAIPLDNVESLLVRSSYWDVSTPTSMPLSTPTAVSPMTP